MSGDLSEASGWAIGWSEQFAMPYYYHAGHGLTQWHFPTADDLSISRSGDETAAPSRLDEAAESAVASALGFVDPIVHAVATRILTDGISDRTVAIGRLQKHLAASEAAVCASALLGSHLSGRSANGCSDEDSEDCEASTEFVRTADDSSVPWQPARASSPSLSSRKTLDAELRAFADWIQPQPCEIRARSAIKRLIARCLQPLSSSTTVEPYGSSRNGLSLFCSDLDLAMSPSHPLKSVASLLSEFRPGRDGEGPLAFMDVDVLPSRRVPIVCCTHRPTRIEIDISRRTDHDQDDRDAAKLAADCTTRHPMMRQLALALKVCMCMGIMCMCMPECICMSTGLLLRSKVCGAAYACGTPARDTCTCAGSVRGVSRHPPC